MALPLKKVGDGQQTAVQPPVTGNDDLAAEHELVRRWTEEALRHQRDRWYSTLDLQSLPVGREILAASPDRACRIVLAAISQLQRCDEETECIRSSAQEQGDYTYANCDQWRQYHGSRCQTAIITSTLLKRALPFDASDLVKILEWCNSSESYLVPTPFIVRALNRFNSRNGLDAALRGPMRAFAAKLRTSHDKSTRRYGTTIEQLLADDKTLESGAGDDTVPTRPVQPAVSGHHAVLIQLKRQLTLPMTQAPESEVTILEPGHFELWKDSPIRAEHELLAQLFTEAGQLQNLHDMRLGKLPTGKRIKSISPAARGRVLLAACERASSFDRADIGAIAQEWRTHYFARSLVFELVSYETRLDRAGLFDLLLYAATRDDQEKFPPGLITDFIGQVERAAEMDELSEGERYTLYLLRDSLIMGPPLGVPEDNGARLSRLIGDGALGILVPGEVWSDALNTALANSDAQLRKRWVALLVHLLKATTGRPSTKWQSTATKLVDDIGRDRVRDSIVEWLRLVPSGRSRPCKCGKCDNIHEENANCLRGMLWILPALDLDSETVRVIAATAHSAYRKAPGVGPRAVKVGNAVLYALSQIPLPEAVGQLAMLKTRVKFGTAQKEIEKAFTSAAERAGLAREEIEELGVPAYGLEDVGRRRETFGDDTAELVIVGSDSCEIRWTRGDGKSIKSVPAAVKKEHAEALKELSQAAKDIQAMLPSQRERIDSLLLAQKSWPFETWRERYLDHPLIGAIARRLIWQFSSGRRRTDGIFLDGSLVDVNDKPIDWLSADPRVEMWHPIGRQTAEVLDWRSWLERHQVRQPFKQAHREIYILTDAERNTRVYSNRYAAHVLRQHQFNALCAARGWKNKLRLLVDADYPPATRSLPGWNLRAEFWIEGIGDDYGNDTNDSGVFHRVATDQVRFYALDAAQMTAHVGGVGYGPGYRAEPAEPLPLEQIPPLVFSEIMRDVDLFVGVASVGNDPAWQDGGPDGRFRDYWGDYAFGNLSETAKTRREVLTGLLPRLKIADRCTLTDKFLVVRGELRTYKIHLGSSNILMEPNDQYLCIVPGRGAAKAGGGGNVFLPFEGDDRLSVILSKAFLLANDNNITDPTILRQIKCCPATRPFASER